MSDRRHGGLRNPPGGRPPMSPEGLRVYKTVRLDPGTDATIRQERQPKESYGQTIDRIVRDWLEQRRRPEDGRGGEG